MDKPAVSVLRQTLLIVDDTPTSLSLLISMLKDHYRVLIATNGRRALDIAAASPQPDLVLLDVMMPSVDGYEVCVRLKTNHRTKNIPVIFLTARATPQDEEKGLRLGAADYISKPFSPPVLLGRINTHLSLRNAHHLLEQKNNYLEAEISRRISEISTTQDATIIAMALLAETRCTETGNHIRRTQHYVRLLAQRLKHHRRFADLFSDTNIELLYKSAALHDIGKVGIPDSILLKPGALSREEFGIMKTHTTLGRDAILEAERELGMHNSFLHFAREIAYSQHERWDGSGYPNGLRGDEIPAAARLMAVADVYDALISRRAYKPEKTHDEVVRIICDEKGAHFDPDVVVAFLGVANEFNVVRKQLAEENGRMSLTDNPLPDRIPS